jgi:hypothetical protein
MKKCAFYSFYRDPEKMPKEGKEKQVGEWFRATDVVI